MEGKKAVIYCRVSTAGQAEQGVSLEAQEERLRAYCQMQGLDIEAVLIEEGVSATKPLHVRPMGSKLVEMVKSGTVQHVVALKLDRLFRSSVDALATTSEWDQNGIALHLVDMGGQSINTASAMGRMMLTMMAGFAQFERDLISERTTAALQHKKAHNRVYGPVPFGKDRNGDELEVNEEELSILEKIRLWRKQGASYWTIAARLNAHGIKGKGGGKWYAASVRYVLNNALVKEAQ
jgi:DNA invertase Pin-like site-specific DNA recombinase